MFTMGHLIYIYFVEIKQLFRIPTVTSTFIYFSLLCARKDITNMNLYKSQREREREKNYLRCQQWETRSGVFYVV